MPECIVCGRERDSSGDDVHQLHEIGCNEPEGGCDCDVVACSEHCPSCCGDDAQFEIAELVNHSYAVLRVIARNYFNEVVRPWLDSHGGLGLYMVNGHMEVMSPDGSMLEQPDWMKEEFDKTFLGVRFGNQMPTYMPWLPTVNYLDANQPT